MKLPLLAVAAFSAGLLFSCSSTGKQETATLIPFKDTFDWRPYHLSQGDPQSADGRFRFVSVSQTGDVTLRDLSSGQCLLIRHDQTMNEIVVSKMPMRVTRFDFTKQTADFECLTTK